MGVMSEIKAGLHNEQKEKSPVTGITEDYSEKCQGTYENNNLDDSIISCFIPKCNKNEKLPKKREVV